MIGAEAPVLFAKAAEMFILELTLRAWIHTEENKRYIIHLGIFFCWQQFLGSSIYLMLKLNWIKKIVIRIFTFPRM